MSFNSYKGFIEIIVADQLVEAELIRFNSYKGFIEIAQKGEKHMQEKVSIPIKDSLKCLIE